MQLKVLALIFAWFVGSFSSNVQSQEVQSRENHNFLESLLAKKEAAYAKAALDLLNDLSEKDKREMEAFEKLAEQPGHLTITMCPCDFQTRLSVKRGKVFWKDSYWRCIQYDQKTEKCLAVEKLPNQNH